MLEHLHQLAVHAYYAGELDAGRRACERLLGMGLTPEKERVVRRNRTWYTQRLDDLVGVRMRQFDVDPANEGWVTFNPTIVADKAGYTAIVRSSNYRIVDGGYEMLGDSIRTKNIIVGLYPGLVFRSAPVVLNCDGYPKSTYTVDGFEDCRLNNIDGDLVVSATIRNWAGRDGTCRIATATVRGDGLAAATLPEEPVPGRHEKNWMPIIARHEWLYACWDDGKVATVRRDADRWLIERHADSPAIARGWRGGSQLVDVGDGRRLALVHEVADDTGGRIYEHRFVLFGDDGRSIAGWSPAFAFRELRAIEFAAGLARRDDHLVATFGVRDAEAWMAEMSLSDVLRIVKEAA